MTEITFEPLEEGPGLTMVDSLENRQFPLRTSEPIDPRETNTDWCPISIDAAVEFSTETLVLPYVVPTCVRDTDGELLLEAEHYAFETLPEGEYLLELMAPVKCYIDVRSGVTIASADDRLSLDFGERTHVRIGAQSIRKRPEATVTTTADPTDLARAISTFGSGLEKTSCERSLPTHRGHPPLVELGDRVHVPEDLDQPDTGVTIVAPDDRTAVYATCSLAYYLGATVVTGERPRIETDRGFEYELGRTTSAFTSSLERILEHVFFLDTITRTEGIYDIDLHERRLFDAAVDVDLEELYEAPLAEQLRTYLSIPFETVDRLSPRWQLVTYVSPDAANATALPFLANDLSLVREAPPPEGAGNATPEPPPDVVAFTRSLTRSEDETSGEDDRTATQRRSADSYVSLPDSDAFETAWLGEGVPLAANKLFPDGFEHRVTRSPSSDAIDITVVCNDSRMVAEYEDQGEGLYGNRDELPFSVTVRQNLSVDSLRAVIEEDTDFLHYIGHVDGDAFVCRDGDLEARTLTEVGVDTFLINGCRSYDPGVQLIEAGSAAGIVTLSEVGNRDATAVGRLMARLLNCGFTMRSAVGVAREHRFVGNQYIVVGDGNVTVAQSGGSVPNQCRVEPTDDGRYELQQQTYHSQRGVGALYIPYLDDVDRYFLAGTELPPVTLSGGELERFFQLEQIPIVFDGEFLWSTDDRLSSL